MRDKNLFKHLFLQYASDVKNIRENSDKQRYTHLSSSEYRFYNQHQKVSVQTNPSIRVFWSVSLFGMSQMTLSLTGEIEKNNKRAVRILTTIYTQ